MLKKGDKAFMFHPDTGCFYKVTVDRPERAGDSPPARSAHYVGGLAPEVTKRKSVYRGRVGEVRQILADAGFGEVLIFRDSYKTYQRAKVVLHRDRAQKALDVLRKNKQALGPNCEILPHEWLISGVHKCHAVVVRWFR